MSSPSSCHQSRDQWKQIIDKNENTILGLSENVSTVDRLFKRTLQHLQNILNVTSAVHVQDLGPFTREVLQYRTGVIQKHKAFLDLFWYSKKVAGSAQAVADDFARVFVPMMSRDDIDNDDKLEEIPGYLEKLERDEAKARYLAHQFATVSADIKQYADPQYGIAAHFRETTAQLGTDLTQLSSDIEAMDNALKEIHMKLAFAGGLTAGAVLPKMTLLGGKAVIPWTATSTGAVSLVGGCSFATVIGAIVGVGIAIFGAKILTSMYTEQRQELKNAVRERDTKQFVHSSFIRLDTESTRAQKDLMKIAKNIEVFVSIWANIRAEVQSYCERLRWQCSGETRSDLLSTERAKMTREQYAKLSRYLEAYQKAVTETEMKMVGLSR